MPVLMTMLSSKVMSQIGSLVLSSLLACSPGVGQPKRAASPRDAPRPGRGGVIRDVVYATREGFDPEQTSLDIYPVKTGTPAPVVVFVHGGGWSIGDKSRVESKPAWANANGWAFVSVNYRLSPGVMYPEHGRDVAAAVAWVHDHAREFNADPDRIVLMGHSAGAHLVAIVSSDEKLLGEVGMTTDQIAGVVPLDGAGYDLTRRMKDPPRGVLGRMFKAAFGDDPALWAAASPTLQAEPGDRLPPMFCVRAGDRIDALVEGTGLVRAWRDAGAAATLYHAADKNHRTINHDLGAKGDPDTPPIEAFIRGVFAGD